MMNPAFKLGENAPTVSWADSKNSDSSTSSQVLTRTPSLLGPKILDCYYLY
jgi:hypothetical protein